MPPPTDDQARQALLDTAPVFPRGSHVVHIGPHKTGTTALQESMHRNREAMAEQGVRYIGPGPQSYSAAIALTGGTGIKGTPPVPASRWTGFVDEVDAAGDDSTMASSESFSSARPEHIERLAHDLDPGRVQVIRMVRAYDRLLPSWWQQLIARGQRPRFEPWLDKRLRDPAHPIWSRHGFATLTRRWADGVGPDRVTVVIVNDADRSWLTSVMERQLGLRPGTLQVSDARANRSLRAGESEMLRQVTLVYHQMGWSPETHLRYLRRGISWALRAHEGDPEDPRVRLDARYAELVGERTVADLAALHSLGVSLVGEPAWLDPGPLQPVDAQPLSVARSTALVALGGVVRQATRTQRFALDDAAPGRFLELGVGVQDLPRGGAALVDAFAADLVAQGHPAADVERFAHRGAAAGLKSLLGAPEIFAKPGDDLGASLPDGRIAPRVAAAALAGVVAVSDTRLDH